MTRGKTIINIDESVINKTDQRQYGLCFPQRHNMVTTMQRPPSLSIIVAVSSKGQFLFTVNSGKNNSNTFLLFLIKLCNHLDETQANWRHSTILMIDNAPYH